LKRFVFISLSLLLLIIVTGCFTFQTSPPAGTPPVIGSFSNSPSTINSGGTSTLLWNVTGANMVSIDQGIGQVNVAGTRVVSPPTSTVYTISATNSAGTVSRSAVAIVGSASPPAPFPGSFSVVGITAGTEPRANGCFNLYSNITANGAGTASYMWEASDGGYSYTWNVTFPTAGTQKITVPVEMSGLPSGLYRVHVLTPNDVVSNTTEYTTCGP
jgi:hypothetical protein